MEVGKQVFEASVSIFCFTEALFVVEGDGMEYAFEFGLVCIFDVSEGLVDEFAEVVGIALTIEAVKIAAGGELEALAIQAMLDHFRLAGKLFLEGFAAFLDEVGKELEEKEGQDVILVLIGRHDAAKGVAGFPDDVVDFVLTGGGWSGHGWKVVLKGCGERVELAEAGGVDLVGEVFFPADGLGEIDDFRLEVKWRDRDFDFLQGA